MKLHFCGGWTPVPDATSKCPQRDTHTWHPTGYAGHSDWADERLEAGWVQVQCPACELWAWWLPPGVVSPEQIAAQAARTEDS